MAKKKSKWYLYEQYEGKDGSIKERRVSQKRIQNQDFSPDEVSWSRDDPKIRKEKREDYEDGLNGTESFRDQAPNYVDTVEWGKRGGRPRKWPNDAERKRVKRAEIKLLKESSKVKQTLVIPVTFTQSTDYAHSNPRPGSYTYHSDRPAPPKERVKRHRSKRADLYTSRK